MYFLLIFGGHRSYRSGDVNPYINSDMNILEKAELNASMHNIEYFQNQEYWFTIKATWKSLDEERKQKAIAERYRNIWLKCTLESTWNLYSERADISDPKKTQHVTTKIVTAAFPKLFLSQKSLEMYVWSITYKFSTTYILCNICRERFTLEMH